MQKVHLWMEISADCPNRGRRSLTKMDRQRNVRSSVWTLQQILSDEYGLFFFPAVILIPSVKKMSFENGNGV